MRSIAFTFLSFYLLVGCSASGNQDCAEPIVGCSIDELEMCADRSRPVTLGCRDRESYPMVMGLYTCYRNDTTSEMALSTDRYLELFEQGWSECDPSGLNPVPGYCE
jgi:hypothetical protein